MDPLYLTCRQLRELDRQAIEAYGVPSVVLMENAGRGAAELLIQLGISGKVVICCGKGNNGGDGLVIARHLDSAGIPVEIILTVAPEQLAGDAAVQLNIVRESQISIHYATPAELTGSWLTDRLSGADWIIDALFGTGLSGPLRAPFDSVVKAINGADARRLAVDIPSGLDGDTGIPMGETVRADHTVTFVAQKLGFAKPGADGWLGKVHVVPIGMPRRLLESAHSI
jgi:NAD(P)H-hydrate epimerase